MRTGAPKGAAGRGLRRRPDLRPVRVARRSVELPPGEDRLALGVDAHQRVVAARRRDHLRGTEHGCGSARDREDRRRVVLLAAGGQRGTPADDRGAVAADGERRLAGVAVGRARERVLAAQGPPVAAEARHPQPGMELVAGAGARGPDEVRAAERPDRDGLVGAGAQPHRRPEAPARAARARRSTGRAGRPASCCRGSTRRRRPRIARRRAPGASRRSAASGRARTACRSAGREDGRPP